MDTGNHMRGTKEYRDEKYNESKDKREVHV